MSEPKSCDLNCYNYMGAMADCEHLQARIDELMLEYCPDEMTPEQLDNWGKHQVLARGNDNE